MPQEKVTVYREWLPLGKRLFGILAVVAEHDGFTGNLKDLYSLLAPFASGDRRSGMKKDIESLEQSGFLKCENCGRVFRLTIAPKENEVKIFRAAIRDLRCAKKFSENVAWEQVLKVYIWCWQNKGKIVTNATISKELGGLSPDTISKCKNVLEHDFQNLFRETKREKIAEDVYLTYGQELLCGAWW